jgi:hypothetical protein
MGRPRKYPLAVIEGDEQAGRVEDSVSDVEIRILRDGVFMAEDVRKNKGDVALADPDIAAILVEYNHAQYV